MRVTKSFVILALAAFPLTLGGCQSTSGTQAAAVPVRATDHVDVRPGDLQNLAGVWEGTYRTQNGFTGKTRMTLAAAGPDRATAVFEFMWDPNGHSRSPAQGAIPGQVLLTGEIQFGAGETGWDVELHRRGGDLVFTAQEPVGGQPASLTWSKQQTGA